MHVETLSDGTVLATLTGALDHHTVDRLTDAVRPALGTTAPTVWLDLAGLTFLDSSGLTRLLHLYRAARQTGGHLALIAPGGESGACSTSPASARSSPTTRTVPPRGPTDAGQPLSGHTSTPEPEHRVQSCRPRPPPVRRASGLPLRPSLAVHRTQAYTAAIESALTLPAEAAERIRHASHLKLLLDPSLSVVPLHRIGWTTDDYQAWSQRLPAGQTGFVAPTGWEGRTVGRLAPCTRPPRRKWCRMLAAMA
ncbi:STAS domain-containing protein [Streptomyces sp. NPDC017676]|uniref:STAS domain-containing protein n=1 Tax=Streptomyces sp. NPDC017676 TaxID=3365006 RepID=UPI0037A2B0FD